MRVFITGATGFVGPAVANAIADAGHDVRVLERQARRGEGRGPQVPGGGPGRRH